MPKSNTARFIENDEAARLLRLSPRTLEKWRVRGVGPVYRKFGGRVLYAIEDLEAYAHAQRRFSTSQAR
jgi:hypothetical protein